MQGQGNIKKADIRIIKTHQALISAMSKLLELRNFSQITVNDLCDEAQISRTTFYSHFNDKYDLLEYWFESVKPKITNKEVEYADLEKSVNNIINSNLKIIRNLVENANCETYKLLSDFMFSFLSVYLGKDDNKNTDPEYMVLSKFCSGGMMNYLMWQIENKFPKDLQVMNIHIYDILKNLLEWYENHK